MKVWIDDDSGYLTVFRTADECDSLAVEAELPDGLAETYLQLTQDYLAMVSDLRNMGKAQ